MLSDDPPAVRRPACLVARRLRGVTERADDLRAAGWPVHVLACGSFDTSGLRAAGVEVTPLPEDGRVPELYGDGPAERSDHVRHALARLHRTHKFGVIEFECRGGLAARAVQAKQTGLDFADVTLAVRLDGTSQLDREAEERWPADFAEVECDFLERIGFEGCDVACVPDPSLAAVVGRNGWVARPDAVCSAAGYPHAANVVIPPQGAPLVTVAIAHFNLGRFLPDTLATLAQQTYPNLEVIVIDDGSTDPESVAAFETLRARYPGYQFHRQANAGIGVTRNRCLALARGEFFVPVDADNLARPEMIERFVAAMTRNPGVAAMSCYFLAFDEDAPDLTPRTFLHALRPAGGPHALAGIRNVYGDANAIFRTSTLREIGGYGTDRGTSCEDWELFVKLVHAGHRLGVVPDHLFYYRHRPGGFSRSTNWFANHQRVLRQFANTGTLPPAESLAVWSALLGFHMQQHAAAHAPQPRRHRIADGVYSALSLPLRLLRRSGRASRNRRLHDA